MIYNPLESDIENDNAGRIIIKVEDHKGSDVERAAKSKVNDLHGLLAS